MGCSSPNSQILNFQRVAKQFAKFQIPFFIVPVACAMISAKSRLDAARRENTSLASVPDTDAPIHSRAMAIMDHLAPSPLVNAQNATCSVSYPVAASFQPLHRNCFSIVSTFASAMLRGSSSGSAPLQCCAKDSASSGSAMLRERLAARCAGALTAVVAVLGFSAKGSLRLLELLVHTG